MIEFITRMSILIGLIAIATFFVLWGLSKKLFKSGKSEYWRALIFTGIYIIAATIMVASFIFAVEQARDPLWILGILPLVAIFLEPIIFLVEMLLIKKIYSCGWGESAITVFILGALSVLCYGIYYFSNLIIYSLQEFFIPLIF